MTKFTASAAAFIRKERAYLAGNSRPAGRRFSADVTSVVRMLSEYPLAGTGFGLLNNTAHQRVRRWVKGNYTFDYEISSSGEAVVILVRHHAQNDPFLTFEPDDTEDFDP